MARPGAQGSGRRGDGGTSPLGAGQQGAFPGERCPTEEASPGLTAGSLVTLGNLVNLSEYSFLY